MADNEEDDDEVGEGNDQSGDENTQSGDENKDDDEEKQQDGKAEENHEENDEKKAESSGGEESVSWPSVVDTKMYKICKLHCSQGYIFHTLHCFVTQLSDFTTCVLFSCGDLFPYLFPDQNSLRNASRPLFSRARLYLSVGLTLF